jgi:hypothetical protein
MRRNRLAFESTLFSLVIVALLAPHAVAAPTTAPAAGGAPSVAHPADRKPMPNSGVITAPGAYFFADDIAVDRKTGIEIKADNVTLDLRGHALRFTGEPRPGVNGIVFSNRSGIRITNGAIGGFWFGVQCSSSEQVRIHDVHFDDIVYIAINAANSKHVSITDNVFSNFRYDIPKDAKSTYVIGVNLTSDDVVVANNRFDARPPTGTGRKLAMETVFVLFRPSKNCVVTHNDMFASELLNRSYGVWVAEQTRVTMLHNRVHNMQHGVTVVPDGAAQVMYNEFTVMQPSDDAQIDTVGIAAPIPNNFSESGNTFRGQKTAKAIGTAATKPAKPATDPA